MHAGRVKSFTRRSALVLSLALSSRAMAADGSQQPEDFPYIQLWASADGETHIKEFKAKGFDLKKYASVRNMLNYMCYCGDQCTRLQPGARSYVPAWQKRCLPPAYLAI